MGQPCLMNNNVVLYIIDGLHFENEGHLQLAELRYYS